MFSHAIVGSNNLVASLAFYNAVMPHLGFTHYYGDPAKDTLIGFHDEAAKPDPKTGRKPSFWVCKPLNGQEATHGNGVNIGLQAHSREAVDKAHKAAVDLGGVCEGAPGLRPEYHENWYCCYVRDLDGNKLCIVCQIPAEQ